MKAEEIETEFNGRQVRYSLLLSEIQDQSDAIERYALDRDETRATIRSIEATIWANGGTHACTIDGKNEKQREAQFHVACESVGAWKDATSRLRAYQAGFDAAERAHAASLRELRALELRMQFNIEQFQLLNTPRFYRNTNQT